MGKKSNQKLEPWAVVVCCNRDDIFNYAREVIINAGPMGIAWSLLINIIRHHFGLGNLAVPLAKVDYKSRKLFSEKDLIGVIYNHHKGLVYHK